MNKYQEIYNSQTFDIAQSELVSVMEASSRWEDAYWVAKILISGNYDVSDEKIIECLEYCFYAGLSISNKDIFYDANELLAKLYIRYGMYNEASAKLMVLACNFDCPDWVHIYYAMTQLYTIFDRIVEEPKYFFDRLLQANTDNYNTRTEVKNIFGKYLCLIVEKQPACKVASSEIVGFAEKLKFTKSEEFKLFHQTVCPEMDYISISDDSEELEKSRLAEQEAKERASKLEEELSKIQKDKEQYQQQLKAQQEEVARLQRESDVNSEAQKRIEDTYKKELSDKEVDISRLNAEKEALEGEKTLLASRLAELEKSSQTEMQPQNIDDVLLKFQSWLNCTLRRYLAQWLTFKFTKNCKGDYWNKKVKPALRHKELEKFDLYKELVDFAIDALLNIYYHNLDDFYPCNSLGKTNDRECIEEMQQIRNRWIGHFEENNLKKERILFDIDTIIQFTEQIEMPEEQRKDYRDFKKAVKNMS